jgi:hypothetical protein
MAIRGPRNSVHNKAIADYSDDNQDHQRRPAFLKAVDTVLDPDRPPYPLATVLLTAIKALFVR